MSGKARDTITDIAYSIYDFEISFSIEWDITVHVAIGARSFSFITNMIMKIKFRIMTRRRTRVVCKKTILTKSNRILKNPMRQKNFKARPQKFIRTFDIKNITKTEENSML